MLKWIANIIPLGIVKWLVRHTGKNQGTLEIWGETGWKDDKKTKVKTIRIGYQEWLVVSLRNELVEKRMKLRSELNKIQDDLDTMSKNEHEEIRRKEEEEYLGGT